ncbi:MAG: ABC transporter permease [Eubacterium sp.]|nr:ABC transporter permease [Eubacterium sp.]
MTQISSPDQERYLNRIKQRKRIILLLRISLLLLFVFLWEYAVRSGRVNGFIFSSPTRIVTSGIDLLLHGNLLAHTGITLAETGASFALVIGISFLIAILLWWNQSLCDILEPYLVILNSLPKSAMAPIFLVWLGNNMKAIIVTAVSVAIFGSILNLYTSFTSTDPDKLKLIRTLGGNRLDCLTKVVIPISFPSILSIMKVDIGLCLIGVVIGEFLAARKGLGYLIIYGSQVFKMDWVMLSIILLCIIAALLYIGISGLEKKQA